MWFSSRDRPHFVTLPDPAVQSFSARLWPEESSFSTPQTVIISTAWTTCRFSPLPLRRKLNWSASKAAGCWRCLSIEDLWEKSIYSASVTNLLQNSIFLSSALSKRESRNFFLSFKISSRKKAEELENQIHTILAGRNRIEGTLFHFHFNGKCRHTSFCQIGVFQRTSRFWFGKALFSCNRRK